MTALDILGVVALGACVAAPCHTFAMSECAREGKWGQAILFGVFALVAVAGAGLAAYVASFA